jgi:DNA-binding transcriptional LysR family regulator
MDELTSVRTFLLVVETGSFSSAARRKNTTASSIARQINALEETLSVRLLNRTTRAHNLTEAGRLYYDRMSDLVRSMDNVSSIVSSFHSNVKGVLRVQLRTSAAMEVIVPELPKFLLEYPDLSIDLQLSDERVDLVKNNIDVAVWLGQLDDSSIIARQLSRSHRVVCGSPAYFAKQGEPQHPMDLIKHNCLIYSATNYQRAWRLKKGSDQIDVPVSGNLQTSSSTSLMRAALHGLGLIVVQEWMVRRAIERGELRCVLPDYEASPTDDDTALYAVYPQGDFVSQKTRAFVDFLVALFKESKSAPSRGLPD